MKQIPECFATTPIVYAVRGNYQIIVPVTRETLMWVEVGGKCFYDDVNGILRSNCTTHKMTVPMERLDAVGAYKICYRIVNERKPYYSDVSDVFEYASRFYPVKEEGARFFHISDAHSMISKPVAAAQAFGEIDFLILNGDLTNTSDDIKRFITIHRIAAEITNGEKPVVFARGNGDMRGICAENSVDHTPTDNGRSYYTFRLGSIWGMVLDCGEDKPDSHVEYANTICCADFRERQSQFIKDVIVRSNKEYEEDGVKHRMIVMHVPFTEYLPWRVSEHDMETYKEWATLLKEYVKPHLMICGHIHQGYITYEGDELDRLGQACPLIVGSAPGMTTSPNILGLREENVYISAGFETIRNGCIVTFWGNDKINYKQDTIIYWKGRIEK